MSTISLKVKPVLGLGVIVLAVITLVAASTTAQAQSGSGYYFDIRSIYTGLLGVTNPAGVAFASPSDHLVIFDTPRAGQTNTTVVLVPYREAETVAGSKTVPVPDPIDVALDVAGNRYWVLDQAAAALVDMPTQPDGSPDALSAGRSDVRALGIQNPQGMTFDPRTGKLFILDAGGPRVLEISPDAQGNLNPGSAASSGRVAQADLAWLGIEQPRGLALNPNNGHLYLMGLDGPRLHEFTETGTFVSTRNLADLKLASPQGMVFAPSGDNTDDPATMNLYVADAGQGDRGGRIIELSLEDSRTRAAMLAAAAPTLIQTIDTWKWLPPSPDPSGLAYWPATGHLLVSDGEVDEIDSIFTGDNVFEMGLNGTLASTYSTMSFTREPTGVAVNWDTGVIFYVQDVGGRSVFEVGFGRDGVYGNSNDEVHVLFSTQSFGSSDPEGLAYGGGKLFVADGLSAEIYVIAPGSNGIFDGVDDEVTHFDTAGLGARDPEGIDYDPVTGNLWIVSRPAALIEVTQSGSLLRSFKIWSANPMMPAGVAAAPGSNDPGQRHIYVSDRMVDNASDPNENDGRIYEFAVDLVPFPGPTITPTSTPTSTPGVGPTQTPTPAPAQPAPGGDLSVFLPFIIR